MSEIAKRGGLLQLDLCACFFQFFLQFLGVLLGDALLDLGGDALDQIFSQTRNAAYEIIQRKGSTYYAVAAGLMRIVEAMLRDQNTVLSVSSLLEKEYYGIEDVCLSIPAVVDSGGVERVLHLSLDAKEVAGLQNSAKVLKDIIAQLKL